MTTEVDTERVITVNIYDSHASNANFKVKPETTAAEICKIILSKRDILSSESKYFSVVLVVSAFNNVKKIETHCLRTLKPNESLLEVQKIIFAKMMAKCSIADESKLENTEKWYFKDMRSNPIDLGATSLICGEYDSDEDEEISQSDLSYLAKSERKGFLLKRSNSDFNLWRRWYCVLMDQLWCVDTTREAATAKCVHLSGMIRYREGQKTLDQLQIIIINSADGKSHFFRAFNLIDQKKWLQDLNIKTRVAADNDTFAMAEMIITDEVDTRCCRLARQLGDVLDQAKAMEAIALRRAVELSSGSGKDDGDGKGDGDAAPTPTRHHSHSLSTPEFSFSPTPISRTNSMSMMRVEAAPKPNINFMLDPVSPPKGASGQESPTSKVLGPGVGVDACTPSAECIRLLHPRACSCLSLETLSICGRVEGQPHLLLHELHRDSRVVTEIMLFVLDVQRFREALRIDLNVPVLKRQQVAKDLYVRHILPQLLHHADLTAYPEFQHEMMQLGGGRVSSCGSAAAPVKLVSPTSPARLSSLSSKGTAPPLSPASSKHTRSEYSSRVRSRGSTAAGKDVTSPVPQRTASVEVGSSAYTTINWGVDASVLMRVHYALFELHLRTVEIQNGLATQDPMQLLKLSAGSSKFRMRDKDRSYSTASTMPNGGAPAGSASAAGASTPTSSSSSYWPWFGFSSNSTSVSPTPSRRGSDAAQQAAAAAAAVAPAPLAIPATTAPAGESQTAEAAANGHATMNSSDRDEVPSSAAVASIGIAEGQESGSGKPLVLEDPACVASAAPITSSSFGQQQGDKSPLAGAVSDIGDAGAVPGVLKAPPVTLFDEVVSVLIQKLN